MGSYILPTVMQMARNLVSEYVWVIHEMTIPVFSSEQPVLLFRVGVHPLLEPPARINFSPLLPPVPERPSPKLPGGPLYSPLALPALVRVSLFLFQARLLDGCAVDVSLLEPAYVRPQARVCRAQTFRHPRL